MESEISRSSQRSCAQAQGKIVIRHTTAYVQHSCMYLVCYAALYSKQYVVKDSSSLVFCRDFLVLCKD
jgi:hypothetical protein